MLQKKYITETPSINHKNNQPLWTQEEAIAFESARETIGHMMAICSFLMGQEEEKEIPNLIRIKLLRAKQAALAQERLSLRLKDHVNVTRTEQEYGLKIKAFEEDGKWDI